MSRRKPYTKVEKSYFENPPHVKGMGDKTFRGFQCLNKLCNQFMFIQAEVIDPDFRYQCEACGFVHKSGEVVKIYDYTLVDTNAKDIIEHGSFEILHDDYLAESKEFKYCIICGSLKPFELFDVHGSRRTGRQGECKICKQIYNGIKNQTSLVEQHREASQRRRLYTHFESHEKLNINEIYTRFGNRCFKCNVDLSNDLLAGVERKEGNLDHTLPVYYLWPLTTGNATLLCREHNGEKAEKWPSRFYKDADLRRLSSLTGITYRDLSGEPFFNPSALESLKDPEFVELLFEKFARYPHELLRLRNRILGVVGFDFLDMGAKISPDWKVEADNLIKEKL